MKHKILVDLKPAFDGYAGIPQEARLLFACLNELDNIEIDKKEKARRRSTIT